MTPALSAAERLLQSLAIEKPRDIDLEAIAWSVGAEICFRNLDGCEARIVGRGNRAIISVAKSVPPSRQRFSICHELGHWHHHKGQLLYCQRADMHQREVAAAKENEANRYASDVLLPPYLVRPLLRDAKAIEMALVKAVANEFSASLTATAIKLVRLIGVPSMVVCHGKEGRKWYVPGPAIPRDWFPRPELDPRSTAFTALFSSQAKSCPSRRVSAGTWFNRRDAERYELLEQTFSPKDGQAVTILTFSDPRMLSETSETERRWR